MIIDTLENVLLYQGVHSMIAKIPALIAGADQKACGRYELEGGHLFVIYEGETRDGSNVLFEAHDRYIDLQIIEKGAERVEWAPRSHLMQKDPVDPVKDLGFYRGEGDGIDILAGMFYLAFPQDAHKSICHPKSGSCDYRKYIFKLRVEW